MGDIANAMIAGATGGSQSEEVQNAMRIAQSTDSGGARPAPQLAPADQMMGPLPGPQMSAPNMAAVTPVAQGGADPLAPLPEINMPQPEEEAPNPEPHDSRYTPYDDPERLEGPPPIEVKGDSWQPRRLNPIVQVLDFLLTGGIVSGINKKRNIKDAFQETGGDHSVAINRIRRYVDPALAEKLEGAHQSHVAEQRLAEERQQKMEKERGAYVGAIFTPFSIDIEKGRYDPKAYEAAKPMLQALSDKMGFTVPLPDANDREGIKTIASAGMNGYQHIRTQQFEDAAESQAEHRRLQRESLQEHRVGERAEKQRANQADEALAREKFALQQQRGDKGSKTIFSLDRRDDKGRPMPAGSLSSDGRKLMLRGEDGQLYVYKLRKVGDITSRVIDHAATEELRKKMEED